MRVCSSCADPAGRGGLAVCARGACYLARERHVQALRQVDQHLAQASTLLALQAQALDLLAEELRLTERTQ